MINRLTPHAALPVWIARRVGHDAGTPLKAYGDIFTRAGLQSIVTGHATVRGSELLIHSFRIGLSFCWWFGSRILLPSRLISWRCRLAAQNQRRCQDRGKEKTWNQ